MSLRRCGVLAALVAGFLSSALGAQSYGVGEQVLTLGAAAFRGTPQPVFHEDGYLYNGNPSDGFYYAPFRLPDGAAITRLCAYLRNGEAAPSVTFVGIQAIRMSPGGPNGEINRGYVNPSFNSGYAEFCADIPFVFHDDADVDGDTHRDHVTYHVKVLQVSGATIGFGGARIFWHRQVSAPPAQATFGDVPTSHPFFQSIEALAASAITGGCGSGNFCPNSSLTRGQMAVFLAKALGLHWVN